MPNILEWEISQHYYLQTREVVFQPIGMFSDFDGITRSGQLSFEVKLDVAAMRSGNFAFEVSASGKPSGLSVTKADLWVHWYPLDRNPHVSRVCCMEFEVPALRARLHGCHTIPGGNNNAAGLVLLPVAEARKVARGEFTVSLNFDLLRPSWCESQKGKGNEETRQGTACTR